MSLYHSSRALPYPRHTGARLSRLSALCSPSDCACPRHQAQDATELSMVTAPVAGWLTQVSARSGGSSGSGDEGVHVRSGSRLPLLQDPSTNSSVPPHPCPTALTDPRHVLPQLPPAALVTESPPPEEPSRSSRAARMLSQPLPAPGRPCTPPPPHLHLPVRLHPGFRQPPATSLQASGSPSLLQSPGPAKAEAVCSPGHPAAGLPDA